MGSRNIPLYLLETSRASAKLATAAILQHGGVVRDVVYEGEWVSIGFAGCTPIELGISLRKAVFGNQAFTITQYGTIA